MIFHKEKLSINPSNEKPSSVDWLEVGLANHIGDDPGNGNPLISFWSTSCPLKNAVRYSLFAVKVKVANSFKVKYSKGISSNVWQPTKRNQQKTQ